MKSWASVAKAPPNPTAPSPVVVVTATKPPPSFETSNASAAQSQSQTTTTTTTQTAPIPTTRAVVLDTAAFIAGMNFRSLGEDIFTTPLVLNEIRDSAAREFAELQSVITDVQTRMPDDAAIRAVSDFARKTGNFAQLSATDLSVLALTYQIERERSPNGDMSHIRTEPIRVKVQVGKGENAVVTVASAPKVANQANATTTTTTTNQTNTTPQSGSANPTTQPAHQDTPTNATAANPTTNTENINENTSTNTKTNTNPNTNTNTDPNTTANPTKPKTKTNANTNSNPNNNPNTNNPNSKTTPNPNTKTNTTTNDHDSNDDDDESDDGGAVVEVNNGNDSDSDHSDDVDDNSDDDDDDNSADDNNSDDDGDNENNDNNANDGAAETQANKNPSNVKPKRQQKPKSDSEGEWITPENLEMAFRKEEDKFTEEITDKIKVICVTADFAMQNVALQMGLNIVGVGGRVIRSVRQYALKCQGCFKVTHEMDRKFCEWCGNSTLYRFSIITDKKGRVTHFNSRPRNQSLRGTKFPIPKPTGGRGHKFILCEEDYKHAVRKVERRRKAKNKTIDVFDQDFQFGDQRAIRVTKSGRVAATQLSVGGMNTGGLSAAVMAAAAMGPGGVKAVGGGGVFGAKVNVGYGRKNPNENRKHGGKKRR